MTLKVDAIFKDKLTDGLKNNASNSVSFHDSSWKSENLHFDGLLLSIAYKVSAKKCTQELPLMTLKRDRNFEEKLTFCLKNNMRNLVNFNASSGKSENLLFDGLFLSKVFNVWAKKTQRSFVVKHDL